MKRTEKILWMIAGGLFAVGCIIALIAMWMIDFDFRQLSTEEQIETEFEVRVEEPARVEKTDQIIEPKTDDTYEIQRINPIKGLSVSDVDSNITLLPTDSDHITISISHPDDVEYEVILTKQDILTLTRKANHNWIDFDISTAENEMTICLPVADYESLKLETVSGNLNIPVAFTFGYADLSTTSGDVNCKARISNRISINTTSGDLTLENLYVKPEQVQIMIDTTDGNIGMKEIFAKDLSINTVSGDTVFEQVRSNQFLFNSTSGDLQFTDSDFGEITVSTTSGDVTGNLNSAKNFVIETISGNVSVPDSVEDRASCHISTTSGDIAITVNE